MIYKWSKLFLVLFIAVWIGCTSSENTFPDRNLNGSAKEKGTVVELSFTTAYVPDATGQVPSERRMMVYIPAGASENSSQKYPVLYLLHGYGGSYTTWINSYKINEILDVLIAEGKIDPCIVVMPDGSNSVVFQGQSNGGSFYSNSVFDPTYQTPINQNSAFGLFEFYMVGSPQAPAGMDPNSVIGWFENSSPYASMVDKSKRMIAGHSMGGYGAMVLTIKYPSLFQGTAALSAPLAFSAFFEDDPAYPVDIIDRLKFVELPVVRDSMQVAPGVKIAYFNPQKLSISTPLSVIMYSLATMFSPVVKSTTSYDLSYEIPLKDIGGGISVGAALPVDVSGNIKEEVKGRWLAYYDAWSMVNANPSSLANELLYVDCGVNDVTDPMVSQDGAGFGIIHHVRKFHELLTAKGITHYYEEYNGNHSNEVYYRVQKALMVINGASQSNM